MPMARILELKDGGEGITLHNLLSNKIFHYSSPWGLDKYGNSVEYQKLLEKIDQAIFRRGSISGMIGRNSGKFFVNIASIRGHSIKGSRSLYSPDYFTFLPDGAGVEGEPKFQAAGFQSEEEAKRFIDYLRSDFARFCLSVVKTNTHLNRGELSNVPKPDLSKEQTEESIMDTFSLCKEDLNFIRSQNVLYGKEIEQNKNSIWKNFKVAGKGILRGKVAKVLGKLFRGNKR
jgi:hypothetical protein